MNKGFELYLDIRAQEAQDSLEHYMGRKFDAPEKIIEAVKYSLLGSGKKIRPVLMVETARALGEDAERVQPLADAIEMIHTYSLIHDDLPAMDDDDLRRGKPTSHKVFGEDIAILAGDALLNMAMERALEGIPEQNPADYIAAMKLLFHQSGINGMVGGQVADVSEQSDPPKAGMLEYIQTHKTGALLSAAILCGAVPYIGTDDPRVKSLYEYSEALGKIFQIVDDLLDIEGDADLIGKDIGSDERNNRMTFVRVYGIASARERIDELKKEALEAIDKVGGHNIFLKDIVEYISDRKN